MPKGIGQGRKRDRILSEAREIEKSFRRSRKPQTLRRLDERYCFLVTQLVEVCSVLEVSKLLDQKLLLNTLRYVDQIIEDRGLSRFTGANYNKEEKRDLEILSKLRELRNFVRLKQEPGVPLG